LFGLDLIPRRAEKLKHRQKLPAFFLSSPPSSWITPICKLFFALSKLYELRLEAELGVGLGGTRISCVA
jgi:hypothetical protein